MKTKERIEQAKKKGIGPLLMVYGFIALMGAGITCIVSFFLIITIIGIPIAIIGFIGAAFVAMIGVALLVIGVVVTLVEALR